MPTVSEQTLSEPAITPLLDVRHLTVEFGPAGQRQARRERRQLPDPAGRDAGPGGRIRQRQVDDRVLDPAAAAAGRPHHQRRDPVRRRQPVAARRARDARGARGTDLADLPGTDDGAEPGDARRRSDRRGAARARPLARIGGAAGGRAAGGRAHSGCRPPRPRLSAPAVGWHAPARDDCHRAGLQAAARDRRRADDRARRHDPGADPRPAARAAGALQPGVPDHHPRLRRDRRDGRPRGRDARRAGSSRTGPVRQILRAPAHAYTQRLLAAGAGAAAR